MVKPLSPGGELVNSYIGGGGVGWESWIIQYSDSNYIFLYFVKISKKDTFLTTFTLLSFTRKAQKRYIFLENWISSGRKLNRKYIFYGKYYKIYIFLNLSRYICRKRPKNESKLKVTHFWDAINRLFGRWKWDLG